MITIYNPDVKLYKKSAIEAIEDGWISNHGKFIELSTNKLNDLVKSKYSILMANGTCTTHCLFLSLKFKHPDIKKIYVPNNCYVAAWNSALMEYNIENLEVMKMDINTWNISTDEEYIKSLDKNCAVLIVHNLGNIINVPRLKHMRPDLIFVEDNCEGLFGKYENMYSGMSEDSLCSSCSFYGNKIITTGEGGAFFTQHEDIYNYIKRVYSQGMSSVRYLHDIHAYNYRMTNVEAAFLYDQLNDVDNILKNKRKIFDNYIKLFDGLIQAEKIKLFVKDHNTDNADWIFAIRLVGNTKTIDETTAFFRDAGVDIRPFFYPINKHGHLANIENNDSVSEILNQEIIMIPSSPSITIEEQQKVVDVVSQFLFLKEHIKIIRIDDSNVDILSQFITKINDKHFRYFDKRTSDCIVNHVVTFLFYDINQDEYFGYTHIDYDNASNKNWFGIYLDNLYRGKKLGNLLLNYTIYSCNLDIIHLSVDVDNENAIKLYIKNGFSIEQTKNNIHYCTKYIQNGV